MTSRVEGLCVVLCEILTSLEESVPLIHTILGWHWLLDGSEVIFQLRIVQNLL